MATACAFNFAASITETLGLTEGASNSDINHTDYNSGGTDNAGSTVPATKSTVFTPQLVAGVLSIDLTALPDREGGTSVDFTGLKVQGILFNNGTTNNSIVAPGSNALVTVSDPVTNGYHIWGADQSTITFLPGSNILLRFPNNLPDVSATAKLIDLAGTGSDAFELCLWAG